VDALDDGAVSRNAAAGKSTW